MKQILIVGSRVSKLGRSITPILRPMIHGHALVDCHFGDHELRKLFASEDGIDWRNTTLVLLALSSYSHDEQSGSYKLETRILNEAAANKVQVGLIHDGYGTITAPHITGPVLDIVTLVIAESRNDGCSPEQLYSNIRPPLYAKESSAHDIAREIAQLISEHTAKESVGKSNSFGRFKPLRIGDEVDLDKISLTPPSGSSSCL